MAIIRPDRFWHIGASGGRFIAAELPITDENIEKLVENATHLYAFAGQRVCINLAFGISTGRPVTNGAFVDIAEPSFLFSDERELEPLIVEYGGANIELRVTIWNSARTVILSGPTTLALPGGTVAAPGANNTNVQFEVRETAPTGVLDYLLAHESPVTVANLPS